MNRISVLVLCTAALLLPALGGAQEYPLTITQAPYRAFPIEGGSTPVALWTTGSADGNQAVVDLPFPVNYYGVVYNQIKVYSDGYVAFGAPTASNTAANTAIPSTSAPVNAVFLFHDDLVVDQDGLSPKTQVVGNPGSRQFVIEWRARRYLSPSTFFFDMQLWLSEGSKVIQVHYGPSTGTQTNVTASMGIKDLTGNGGISAPGRRGTTCSPNCAAEDLPTAGTLYMYGATPEPDVIPSLTLGAVAEVGNQLQIPLTTTIRNQGLQPAAGVTWNYHFSNDATLDGNDPLMAAHETPETIPATTSLDFPDSLIWPTPAGAGQYRVCVSVDPVAGEVNHTNNVACSTNPIVLGADPAAVSVTFVGATAAVPGQTVSIKYSMKNLGTRSATNFDYVLRLSRARNNSGGPAVVYTGTATLAPGETREQTVQVRVPTTITADQLYPSLDINPDRKFQEASTANNILYGTTAITLSNPDIQPKTVLVAGEDGCFFGRDVTVSYQVCNAGASTASNFVDAIFMNEGSLATVQFEKMIPVFGEPGFCNPDNGNADCTEQQQGVCVEGSMSGTRTGTCHYACAADTDCGTGLSCLADPDLGGQKSCQSVYTAGRCVNQARVVTVPVVDNTGAALLEGREYMFTVVLDPTEKLNEGESVDKILNNVSRSARLTCRYPAPNFSAVSLNSPSRLAAGETVALARDIQNLGNETATVTYRYVLSTNEIFSDQDLRLPLVSTNGDGTLTLGAKKGSKATELVRVPSHVAPGRYFLGLVVDPDRGLHELDKTNNTVAALGQVTVEASGLQVRTPVLPTGTMGGWYGFQLLATGGSSSYEWSALSLPPGVELSRSGYLSGRLTDKGRFPFSVEVRSGEASVQAALVLDVRLPTGSLTINTTDLPVAYTHSNSRWDAKIAISGGLPPYECTFQGLPNRFYQFQEPGDKPGKSCSLYANDGLERAGEYDFSVTVTDSANVSVQGPLHLSVHDSDRIGFKEHRFVEEGLVGQRFQACVESTPNRHVGRDTEGDVGYTWGMQDAPAGMATLVPDPESPSRACLDGVPTECGTFLVRVRVETRLGEATEIDQWSEAKMPLIVQCRQLMLESDVVPSVFRGDTLDVQLRATGPHADVATFRVAAGTLPDGIVLDSNGKLHGVVGAQAAYGAHNVVLELDDGQGGFGYAGLAVVVEPTPVTKPKPAKKESSGCSAAGDAGAAGFVPFGIALAGLLGLGLRRKVVEPVAVDVVGVQRRRSRR